MQCWGEFLEQPHGIFFSTIACEFMDGSLSNPCVASSLWGCMHHRFIVTQFVLLVHLLPGCVGRFLESVIGRILGSGCRIETVVSSLCVSSGCTSYPAAQLVTLAKISASYLVQDPMPWRSGPRFIIWYQSSVATVGFFTLSYIYFCLRPIHHKAIKKILS